MSLFMDGFDFYTAITQRWDAGSNANSFSNVGSGIYSYGRSIILDGNSIYKTFANITGATANWQTIYFGYNITLGITPGNDTQKGINILDGTTNQINFRITAAGIIKVYRNATLLATGTHALAANTTYWIAGKVYIHASAGVITLTITGPGYGVTQEAAYNAAVEAMNKLQTIMISGSLPLKLEIIKLDTISPALGEEFVKNSLFAGLLALVGVSLVLLIRYRSLKIVTAVLITSLSELLMTLGFAALIRWNLDLASIAGLIAALGTGVDDQIVILDELSKGEEKFINWKDRVKRAFGVIIASYLTLTAAMIPLWNAGAGLLRGFAVTTIVGITVGVLITRPAFASVVERILKKE